MKLTLILVGKTNAEHLKEGISLYEKRIGHYIPFEIKILPDVKNSKSLPEKELKIKEGELILKALTPGDDVILLDDKGIELDSVEFAKFIGRGMVRSTKSMIFVIGGAYGFSDDVYNRASMKISLSKMTFSHQLVRLIFAEQLYRAFTIIKGEPYHHS